MARRGRRWWVVAASVLLFLPFFRQPACAQDDRETLEEPAVEVYRLMLAAASARDGDRLTRLLASLETIPNRLQKTFGVDVASEIRMAVSASDPTAIIGAVRRLIFYDMLDRFASLTQEGAQSPTQRQTHLKQAYLNYSVLSSAAKASSPEVNKKVMKLFQQAALVFQIDPSPFAAEHAQAVDLLELRRLTRRIKDECTRIFPELQGQGLAQGRASTQAP